MKRRQYITEMVSEVQTLKLRRDSLRASREELLAEAKRTSGGTSSGNSTGYGSTGLTVTVETMKDGDVIYPLTTQLLITDLSEEMYEDVYPIMEEYRFPGILALTANHFPDRSGMIDNEQFRELRNAGWTYCIAWDGEKPLETWLADRKKQLDKAYLTFPKALYDMTDSWQTDYTDTLLQYGITTVIHSSKAVCEKTGRHTGNGTDVLWHTISADITMEKRRERIADWLEQKDNLSWTAAALDEEFDEEAFRAFLDLLKQWRQDDDMTLTADIATARALHMEVAEQEAKKQSDEAFLNSDREFIAADSSEGELEGIALDTLTRMRLETLDTSIADVNHQIDEIYDAYNERYVYHHFAGIDDIVKRVKDWLGF